MKTVIEMAGQAFETPGTEPAFRNGFWTVTQEELERFAELVRADERETQAEAFQQILEATRNVTRADERARMAEQPAQQEPVAWIEHEWSGTGLRHLHFEKREPAVRDEVVNPLWTPLYTSPQPAQRKPLTDEQIERDWQFLHDEEGNLPDHHDFARAIEAAHGIKEQP